MPTDERSIREKILEELVEAEGKALGGQGLGCEFVMVQKGMRLGECLSFLPFQTDLPTGQPQVDTYPLRSFPVV
jgi:hypothetical protein